MAHDDLEKRRTLTFAQAEGIEPLPRQLNKEEMPLKLRVKLWEIFQRIFEFGKSKHDEGLNPPWSTIFYRVYVDLDHNFSDTFQSSTYRIKEYNKDVFTSGNHVRVYNLIQFILFDPKCPSWFPIAIDNILKTELAAYRIIEGGIIAPIGSQQEVDAINNALKRSAEFGADGARAHLRNAVTELNNGEYSASVRESISAVESIAKVLASDPKAELGKALAVLEKSANIHGGMKAGFNALYGYTSDEKGIRHALFSDERANVDETDALFMIGACSSFVTYLISRATSAGISVVSKS